jgi:hypothetical protein
MTISSRALWPGVRRIKAANCSRDWLGASPAWLRTCCIPPQVKGLLAEAVRFERTRSLPTPNRFRGGPVRPLRHASGTSVASGPPTSEELAKEPSRVPGQHPLHDLDPMVQPGVPEDRGPRTRPGPPWPAPPLRRTSRKVPASRTARSPRGARSRRPRRPVAGPGSRRGRSDPRGVPARCRPFRGPRLPLPRRRRSGRLPRRDTGGPRPGLRTSFAYPLDLPRSSRLPYRCFLAG